MAGILLYSVPARSAGSPKAPGEEGKRLPGTDDGDARDRRLVDVGSGSG
jgi:hypothetical protein